MANPGDTAASVIPDDVPADVPGASDVASDPPDAGPADAPAPVDADPADADPGDSGPEPALAQDSTTPADPIADGPNQAIALTPSPDATTLAFAIHTGLIQPVVAPATGGGTIDLGLTFIEGPSPFSLDWAAPDRLVIGGWEETGPFQKFWSMHVYDASTNVIATAAKLDHPKSAKVLAAWP